MTSFAAGKPWGSRRMHRNDPVFEVSFDHGTTYPNGDKFPDIWVTEPILNDEGEYDGRAYKMIYPVPSFYDEYYPGADPNDADGSIALYYGGCYYDEGMSYTDPEDHSKRIDCFRAAEVLYRHSAGHGNAVANLCLGYVYSYDLCEGHYWVDPLELKTLGEGERPYPREERAFKCLSLAAKAGIPEACYKLGDLYKHGTGCSPNAAEAFHWYACASQQAERERPVVLGSIALRLGGCYEEGFGCSPDFKRALTWYERAVDALEFAVENGEVWYAKALSSARAGMKRCKQEIGA